MGRTLGSTHFSSVTSMEAASVLGVGVGMAGDSFAMLVCVGATIDAELDDTADTHVATDMGIDIVPNATTFAADDVQHVGSANQTADFCVRS